MKRRDFLRKSLVIGAATQFPHLWIKNLQAQANQFRITILQTNDTHSRIDPFPMDGSRNQGLGGIARRATLVNQIRRQNPDNLLLDGGDVLQGTPYFNIYKGKIEYQTMSLCGYDAGTLGNHEFDNGAESLAEALDQAKFPIVNCNFDLGETALRPHLQTFIIRQMGPIKVGITGVGIDFTDLVAPKNHKGISYSEPYRPLQSVVNYLRKDVGCSLVIVLSHLGYKYDELRPSDLTIAERVNGIDWIVGGHTHTFMKEPDVIPGKGGHFTRILQVGWAGIILGKTDLIFEGQSLVSVETDVITVDHSVKNSLAVEEFIS
jgi:5'-nucleotidase